MISNFNQFINEAVAKYSSGSLNWNLELYQKVKKIADSIISDEEIEDYFLELIDGGAKFESKIQCGFAAEYGVSGVGRKRDLEYHDCYPFYKISLTKSVNIKDIDSLSASKKKLVIYNKIIDDVKIAQNRLIHDRNNLEIVKNNISISNDSIVSSFYIRINEKIGSLDDDKPEKLIHKIEQILRSNKLFKVDKIDIDQNYITFDVVRKYGIGIVKSTEIVEAIFKKYVNLVRIIKLGSSDNSDFKIIVIEK